MQIIDAQVHIWSSGTPMANHRQTPVFTAEELIAEMDAAGVHGAVLHPPSWDPDSNEVAVEAARKYPDRFCSLGWFPLEQPESRALVDTWKQRPGMVGLRWALVRPEQQTWHEDGTMDWLWPAAERAGLPVATMAGRFLPIFTRIAEQHPRLRLLIDHLGLVRAQRTRRLCQPGRTAAAGEAAERGDQGDRRARLFQRAYPFRNVHDGLHRIFDAYGPHRFFWGTDITRMPCSYRQCVTMFTEELPWLKGRDLELVMGQGVQGLAGLEIASVGAHDSDDPPASALPRPMLPAAEPPASDIAHRLHEGRQRR